MGGGVFSYILDRGRCAGFSPEIDANHYDEDLPLTVDHCSGIDISHLQDLSALLP